MMHTQKYILEIRTKDGKHPLAYMDEEIETIMTVTSPIIPRVGEELKLTIMQENKIFKIVGLLYLVETHYGDSFANKRSFLQTDTPYPYINNIVITVEEVN